MQKLLEEQTAHRDPLYCCWHGNNLYIKNSKDDPKYYIRFEECDRTNRGWSYLHLLKLSEGLIGTKKVYKLVVRDADNNDAEPFLIISTKYTRGQFNPKPDSQLPTC